jgi:hypothetical protein
MSTSFTGTILARRHPIQDPEVDEFEFSVWRTFGTFIMSLQSRQRVGETEQRTIFYCLESGKHNINGGIECSSICELIREQLLNINFQEDDEETFLTNFRSGSQPIVTVYSPLRTEPTEQKPDAVNDEGFGDLSITLNGQDPIAKQDLRLFQQDVTKKEYVFVQSSELKIKQVKNPSSESPSNEVGNSEENYEELTSDAETKSQDSESAQITEFYADQASTPENALFWEEPPSDPLRLEITQVKFYIPSGPNEESIALEAIEKAESEEDETPKVVIVDAKRRVLMGELPKSIPLGLEVTFQLVGKGASELTQNPFLYHTEVYGENRTFPQKFTLGQAPAGHLADGELTYTCRLAEVNLPEVGTYRLQFFTHLENALVSPDFLELPLVRVA